jgi:hypothetical protein
MQIVPPYVTVAWSPAPFNRYEMSAALLSNCQTPCPPIGRMLGRAYQMHAAVGMYTFIKAVDPSLETAIGFNHWTYQIEKLVSNFCFQRQLEPLHRGGVRAPVRGGGGVVKATFETGLS